MPRINNKTFYENAIKRYGCTARGLNWNSKQSQHMRFEVIHELLEEYLSGNQSRNISIMSVNTNLFILISILVYLRDHFDLI